MKLIHCDHCGRELSNAYENFEIEPFITYGELGFCNEACREEYHNEYCDEEANESDDVSSTCSDCGFHTEHPDL